MSFSFAKHFSLFIKTIFISLILHYLFVMYFPLDWFEKIAIFNQSLAGKNHARSGSLTQPFELELVSHLNKDLPLDELPVDESDQQIEEGLSSASGGTGLEGVDKEKWGDLIERLEANTGFKKDYVDVNEDIIKNSQVSSKYINRDRQHEDIVIKEVFPSIYTINDSFEDILKVAPEQLSEFENRNEIIDQYRSSHAQERMILIIEKPSEKDVANLGPLDFPPNERQKFFDETITRDKSKQLSEFIEKYFHYDPNEGDLPAATRELYTQNLERLLYPFSSDPTYFYLDFYLENLNKEEFLQNALYQASRLNGSKTATELLFAIEAIYEIQQRAWQSYFDFENLYKALPQERKDRLRIETLRRVSERYKNVLQEKEINNLSELENKYWQRRLEVMDHIINNTPEAYRSQDARFHRGAILWEKGLKNNDVNVKQQALDQWKSLISEVKANNYSETVYKDFNNLEHIKLLDALLLAYEQETEARKPLRERHIMEFLLQRQHKRLATKREREEKLLWPKD